VNDIIKILALIPARAGSKGLPGKNIKALNGMPLIAYTIREALKVSELSNVVVSTDSEGIANIAREFGAQVPFLRPQSLATDNASGIDVVFHTISHFENNNIFFDYVLLLQPTSPLRDAGDIRNAINLLKSQNCDSIIGVCESHVHPYLLRVIGSNGLLQDYASNSNKHLRRQDLEKVYQVNGAIYLTSVEVLKRKDSFYGDIVLPYIMSQDKSVDIDNEIDFELAELLFRRKLKNGFLAGGLEKQKLINYHGKDRINEKR
jgi:CMP-N,N'-diacetyllegionaminic acid synthase